jgi:uncharacterized membrane protein YhiD involved in acid resistance
MDQLIDQSLRDFNVLSAITLWELIVVLGLASVLSVVLAQVYVYTHSGHSYSRSFVHTMVFVGITISLIMLIVGSNIARAFALVGAMSIIRFRNPVKDSRDIAFLFMTMAIGMAAGTKFYIFAVIFTAFASFVAVAMHVLAFGENKEVVYVVRLRMDPSLREPVEALFGELGARFAVVSIDKLSGENGTNDFIYEITPARRLAYEEVVRRLAALSDRITVSLLVGEGNVNV